MEEILQSLSNHCTPEYMLLFIIFMIIFLLTFFYIYQKKKKNLQLLKLGKKLQSKKQNKQNMSQAER